MPNRVEFALEFADQSGLHPVSVYSWTKYENDDIHEANCPFNWLNWKINDDIRSVPFISLYPASDGGDFPGYASMALGVKAGLLRLSADRYKGIRATAGKNVDTQLAAIKASDWGTHNLSRVNFKTDDLYWPWVSWKLGEGYWKQYGKQNRAHRPDVFPFFPSPILLLWYARLTIFLAKRK